MQEEKKILDAINSQSFTVDFLDIYNNSDIFQEFVDSQWYDKYVNSFHKTYFKKEELPLDINAKGVSMYSIEERTKQGITNAISRAKYSDLPSEGIIGAKSHTESIGDYGKSWNLTGKEKQKYEKLKKELNGNMKLFELYIDRTSAMIGAHEMQMNLMAAQKMSYTRYSNAAFLDASYNLPVTTKYEVAAEYRDIAIGEKTIEDLTAPILDYIHDIVKDFRDETEYTGALSLKMEEDVFYNLFLKNEQVIEMVKTYNQSHGLVLTAGYMPTKDAYEEWNQKNGSYIPPIELMVQQSLVQGVTTSTAVSGWKSGMMVLSPAGYQGRTEWAYTEEYDQLEGVSDYALAQYDGGFLTIMNRIRKDGRLPVWTTEVLGSYEPVLDEWNYHWCINTKKATT